MVHIKEGGKTLNKVILIGRLTRDPEVKYSQSNTDMCVARYTLAVERRGKNENQSADFINCVAFRQNGEFAEKYLRKGMKIAICGRIQTGSYTNKDGNKVYTTDVVVESAEFCEPKQQASGTPNHGNSQPAKPQTNANSVGDGFMNIPDGIDDQLPWS